MNCPKDQTELRQIVRKGVIIDFCPKCSGVWLDKGELDKIVERSMGVTENLENKILDTPQQNVHRPSYLAGLFDFDTESLMKEENKIGK